MEMSQKSCCAMETPQLLPVRDLQKPEKEEKASSCMNMMGEKAEKFGAHLQIGMNVSKLTSPRERRGIGEDEFWMKGFLLFF